jgi:hypothetical protein
VIAFENHKNSVEWKDIIDLLLIAFGKFENIFSTI